MFRKITVCAALLLSGAAAFAQNAYDALNFSEQYLEGTARSMAMGNAFTALGGDMGGITINPASSAVYKYSEFVITPSLNGVTSNTSYLGNSQNQNHTKFGVSNLGFIGSYNTGRENAGLVSWSFGLVLNKMNNFTNGMKASGSTNSSSWLGALAAGTNGIYAPDMDMNDANNPFFYSNASWNSILAWNNTLLDTLPGTNNQYIAATENLDGHDISVGGNLSQLFKNKIRGNVTEATINFGGNFANKLYVGVNLGIQSISYRYDEDYSESAFNTSQFNSGFKSFSSAYRYRATGSGINLKAGLIYLPTDWLRFGASISTPTWMYIDETWENAMDADFSDGYNQSIVSPLGNYSYMLNTPFRWSVGAAVRLGALGVVSADYENVDYSRTVLGNTDDGFSYRDENEQIQDIFATQNIFRVGAEFNVTPVFAVRAGYQHYSSPYAERNDGEAKNIGSVGIGYVTACGASDFFVDLTYQGMLSEHTENFSLYEDTDIPAPVGKNTVNSWKVLLSLGFRF